MNELNIGTAVGRLVDVSDMADGYRIISDADITGAVVPAGETLIIETLHGGVNFIDSRINGTVVMVIGDADDQDDDDWVPDFQNCEIGENAKLQIGAYQGDGIDMQPVTIEVKISTIIKDCDTLGYADTGAIVRRALTAKAAREIAKHRNDG